MKQQKSRPRHVANHPTARETTRLYDDHQHLIRALPLGLNILEYLALQTGAASYTAIADALGCSAPAVHRALMTLESRGFVQCGDLQGWFKLSGKLSEMQSCFEAEQRLMLHAAPVMQDLSMALGQSCNVSIPCASDMRVVAQDDSGAAFGVRVPIGYRYDAPASAPGLVFAVFMQNANPLDWPKDAAGSEIRMWAELQARARETLDQGFARIRNPYLPDVWDLSCPIYSTRQFAGALTIPYLKTREAPTMGWAVAALQRAAETLSLSLRKPALSA